MKFYIFKTKSKNIYSKNFWGQKTFSDWWFLMEKMGHRKKVDQIFGMFKPTIKQF